MATQRRKFRFLELPLEIREFIYREAFADEVIVHGANHAKVHPQGILMSCKQIHLEGVKTFYSTATFRFWEYDFGLDWYVKMPSIYRDAITKMGYVMQTPNLPLAIPIRGDTAGVYALYNVLDFWRSVHKSGLQVRPGTLFV